MIRVLLDHTCINALAEGDEFLNGLYVEASYGYAEIGVPALFDRQQRPVQEDERLRRRGADGIGQGGCEGGQEVDGLGDVAVCGRGPDAESGGELGVGVPHAQVDEREEGLAAGAQPSPAGVDRMAVPPQMLGEEAQGGAGHVHAGRVDKHAKPLVDTVLLVENPSTRGFAWLSAQPAGSPNRLGNAIHWHTGCRVQLLRAAHPENSGPLRGVVHRREAAWDR
ncbi:hypothetical protein ACE1SV_62130 [Streptomyces sennicomposti]